MNAQGLKSFDEPIWNRREILRYAQCPGCTDENMLSVMEDCIKECISFASLAYRVSYCELPIVSLDEESGAIDMQHIKVTSRSLAANLSGCKEAVVFAASIGPGIDRLIKKYTKLDPVKALFFQAIGAERAESLCEAFMNSYPKKLRPRFSPGFGDLELGIQPDVLAVTNARKNLSITLDEGCLMSPSKSVTAFTGIEV